MTIFNGGAGSDILRGGNGADVLFGGAGDDTLTGGGGSDLLFGGTGRDTLDGGSGSDVVDGGLGDDLLIYRATENRGAYDVYNGGSGTDTLRIVLTAAEWDQAAVRQDVHRFLAYLPAYNEPLGWITNSLFLFNSLGLAVVGVNKLEIVVDGKLIDATDRSVVLADDAVATTENAGVTVDVLAGDKIADGVRSVSVTQPAKGTVELVSTDFAAANPSAVFRFVPGTAFDALKAGETATQAFTYTVTDKDGDKKTATVQVTITGTNDEPVAVADIVTGSAGGVITGNVSLNDSDVDDAAADLNYYVWGSRFETPRSFQLNSDGSWSYDPSSDYAALRLNPGETYTFEVAYAVYDGNGGSVRSTLTVTVTGVNELPFLKYALDDTIYEDSYDSLKPGETVVIESIFGITDYDDGSTFTVTLVDPPADYLGELTLTGYDEEGNATYRFEIDAGIVAALDEGEELVQTYQIVIDDGQGGVVTESFDIRVVGDGNDPIELDYQLWFLDEFADVEGFRTGEIVVRFTDDDINEVHSAAVEWLGDAMGEIRVSGPFYDEDGDGDDDSDGWFVVRYAIPIDQIDARDDALLEQTFRIVMKDAAGSQVTYDRTVDVRRDLWFEGGDGADDISGYGGDLDRTFLVGGAGSDRLQGGEGRDLMFGDAGPTRPEDADNNHYGEEWTPIAGVDDLLDGGGGADRMTGGAGADRFVFRLGEAEGDVVTDFDASSGDRLVILDWGPGATFRNAGGDKWELATADRGTVQLITLTGVTALPDTAYSIEETPPTFMIGTAEDESIFGSYPVRNVIVGGGGRDLLQGGDDEDQLFGDEGPGLPAGSANEIESYGRDADPAFDDLLNGGSRADRLTGGAGADIFEFDSATADGDVVLDFDAAEGDKIVLRFYGEGATFEQLDANRWQVSSVDGRFVEVITFANGATITPDDFSFYY